MDNRAASGGIACRVVSCRVPQQIRYDDEEVRTGFSTLSPEETRPNTVFGWDTDPEPKPTSFSNRMGRSFQPEMNECEVPVPKTSNLPTNLYNKLWNIDNRAVFRFPAERLPAKQPFRPAGWLGREWISAPGKKNRPSAPEPDMGRRFARSGNFRQRRWRHAPINTDRIWKNHDQHPLRN